MEVSNPIMKALTQFLAGSEMYFYVLGIILALIVILKILTEIFNQLRLYVCPRICGGRNLITAYGGKWAVITGGSDGIGRGYAMELAKRGMNICVLSNVENNIADDVKKQYQVDCKWIYVDFSSTDVYTEIKKELPPLDEIGILINNVGMVQTKIETVYEQKEELIRRIMNVNMTAMVMMTGIVVKGMIKRKKGLIVNMGSISSILPLAYACIYSSTKSFVETYSVCLATELQGTNVQVKCLMPWFVRTQLLKNYSSDIESWLMSYFSWTVPDPRSFAASAVATFGVSTPVLYTGFWSHSLVQFMIPYTFMGKKFVCSLFKWFAHKVVPSTG